MAAGYAKQQQHGNHGNHGNTLLAPERGNGRELDPLSASSPCMRAATRNATLPPPPNTPAASELALRPVSECQPAKPPSRPPPVSRLSLPETVRCTKAIGVSHGKVRRQ